MLQIIQFIMGFLGQRFVHFIVYLLIGLVTIGIPYKLFVKDTNKYVVKDGGVINTCEKETPIIGCSIHKLQLKAIWK